MRARGRETRRAILRAAEQVFAERGYVGARMDDVAAEVGIKRASMVYYFRDKRSLYLAVLDDIFGELLPRYGAVATGPGTARDRILAMCDIWAGHVCEHPGTVRILMWETASVRRASAEPLAAELAPIMGTFTQLIRTGQDEGVFRPIDPMRFLMMVTGVTAFLMFGLNVLAADTKPIGTENLRIELRTVVERLLFQPD